MARFRKFASPITSLSVALLLSLAGTSAQTASAGESTAAGTWKSTSDSSSGSRSTAAGTWAPTRQQKPTAVAPAVSAVQQASYTESDDRDANARRSAVALRTASPTPPADNTRWQLPNGKPTAPVAQRRPSGEMQNSSRSMPTAMPHEPKQFMPPAGAAPLASNGSPIPATPRRPTVVNAAATRGAPSNANYSPAFTNSPANRPTTAGRMAASQQAMNRSSRGNSNSGGKSQSMFSTRGMWDTINVAFQDPQSLMTGSTEREASPLPREESMPQGRMMQSGPMTHNGMMHDGYEMMGHGSMGDESYDGYGMSGGHCSCPGGCSECGPMCSDGMCGCEPGCGCGEPCCSCGGNECAGCSIGNTDFNCCGKGDPAACTTVRIGVPKWQELMLFAGVQGFKGPYDQERDSGNFGFHEGFNTGFKVPFTTMGYQFGYQAVHSQLSGDKDTDTSDPHTQQFLTAGVFQRAKTGIQGGIVWDMLRDERWDAVDFHQVRAELAMIENGCHEIGVSATVHLNDDEQFFINQQEQIFSLVYQASDQYLAFYRFHGRGGGEGRFYGGFNDDSDGIVGADMLIPLSNRWSLQTAFTYLIPDDSGGVVGAQQEAWNISTALVWHWDCAARRCHSNCYRPLFNVANNGYLIVDDRPGAAPFTVTNGLSQ